MQHPLREAIRKRAFQVFAEECVMDAAGPRPRTRALRRRRRQRLAELIKEIDARLEAGLSSADIARLAWKYCETIETVKCIAAIRSEVPERVKHCPPPAGYTTLYKIVVKCGLCDTRMEWAKEFVAKNFPHAGRRSPQTGQILYTMEEAAAIERALLEAYKREKRKGSSEADERPPPPKPQLKPALKGCWLVAWCRRVWHG